MHRSSRRGLTLIELIVSIAVSSIVVAATVGMLTAVTSQKRESERYLELQTSASLGFARLSVDLANAGYRFPSSMAAFRVYNDVTGSLVGGETPEISVSQNCGTATGGLIAKSDVLEVATGWQATQPGLLQDYNATTGAYALAGNEPFAVGEPFDGTVMLVVQGSGASCLVRHRLGSGPPGSGGALDILAPDYSLESSPATRYPGCPVTAASARPRIYRLGQRVRYMVCREPPSAPSDPPSVGVLYRQESNVNGVFDALPTALERGIDDLQVSFQVNDPANSISAPCEAAGGAGPRVCTCNDRPGQPCQPFEEVPAVVNDTTPNGRVRSVKVAFLARGPRSSNQQELFVRDALLDRPADTANSRFRYLQAQRTFQLYNFTQVTP